MFRIMKEDGFTGASRCIGECEDRAEAQLRVDRLTASDRIGEYGYWFEEEKKGDAHREGAKIWNTRR